MKIGDAESFVAFDFKEQDQRASMACSVEVACPGFSGRLERVWFAPNDIVHFVSELQTLNETRKGSASLLNLSSPSDHSPLEFEIFSTDQTGHLAVRAKLLKINYVADGLHPLMVSVAFAFDAGDLPSIVIGFRKLFSLK